MVGAALACGMGTLPLQRIQELLRLPEGSPEIERLKANPEWQVAAPHGLCLAAVVYPPHEDPTRPCHPELPHLADGRIDGAGVLRSVTVMTWSWFATP